MEKKIKVLIADDSALMRREIRRILEEAPDLEVVAAARNGQEAVELAKSLRPDVVTLDINMPVMDGLTALQYIMVECPCPVVMFSSLTQDGAVTTYEALELGAVDFVPKPDGTVSANLAKSAELMIETIRGAAASRPRTRRRKSSAAKSVQATSKASSAPVTSVLTTGEIPGVIVIGQSTGGPSTIFEILPHLPADLGLPVFIIQHMPGTFTPSFAKRLADSAAFPFKEVKNGDVLQNNHGYLAPGDFHCRLVPRSGHLAFQLSRTPSDTAHMPSVDISLESALENFGGRTIGVILTGMGADGAKTMVRVRQAGGPTIAESEETCVVFGMPKEAIRLGGAEFVLPAPRIAAKIVELAEKIKQSHAMQSKARTVG